MSKLDITLHAIAYTLSGQNVFNRTVVYRNYIQYVWFLQLANKAIKRRDLFQRKFFSLFRAQLSFYQFPVMGCIGPG
jgi:hypothetical protein